MTQEISVPKFDIKNLSKIGEGKTKEIFNINDDLVLVRSKDRITAFNAQRSDDLIGKAELSTMTTCRIFKYLQSVGIPTHFIRSVKDAPKDFIAQKCEMIPLEWICRRIATGSFLKRHPEVKEGYRFTPAKVEITLKDDEKGDPVWTPEMVIESKWKIGGRTIGAKELELMSKSTAAIFEILERAWAAQGCSLVDMKIEFGVNHKGQILIADVIDSDSWRLWPMGEKSRQLDKQFYRDLPTVSKTDLAQLKENYAETARRLRDFFIGPKGRVVCLMGSASDLDHAKKIAAECNRFGIPCILRVTSAHKGPEETLQIISEYEADPAISTIFVAIAGRSNGLGPVTSGNSQFPVINCPPLGADWGEKDIWSSLRLPSGLGCSTVLEPKAAAQFAAQILALNDHVIWAKLRAERLKIFLTLLSDDKKVMEEFGMGKIERPILDEDELIVNGN